MSEEGGVVSEINLELLKAPFPESEIEWRVSRAGMKKDGTLWAKILAYVTNRAVMDRLDEVCGPENWENHLSSWQGDKAVLCGLSIKIGGRWVTKWDVSENTEFEPIKGGVSGAEKRAGVQWGIGRYLYRLEETWANIHDKGMYAGSYKDKKTGEEHFFRFDPPPLPDWALPQQAKPEKTGTWDVKIANCSTADELRSLYKEMSPDQRVAWKAEIDSKRKELGV